MRKHILFNTALLCLSLYTSSSFAKELKFYQPQTNVASFAAPITKELSNYRVLRQDIATIQSFVQSVQQRYQSDNFSATISIPLLDGTEATFIISNSNILSKSFLDIHTNILSFKGISADGKRTIRLTLSPLGMMGSVHTAGQSGVEYFAPADLKQPENLIVYAAKDMQAHTAAAVCGTDGSSFSDPSDLRRLTAFLPSSQLRTYRLAIAATGEYTTWAGNQTNALSLITNSVNNIDAIYERDCTIHFTLVTSNSVIYPDATTDPYTTVSFPSSATLTENNNALNTNIGSANYDVGVVFGYGWSGGLANLNATCTTNKGKGSGGLSSSFSTGSSGPVFDIMIAHEIGHQFSATHTMAANNGSCNGNVTGSSGWEPGGGSTIMAYAGSCTGNAYQNNSDDYFHGGSLAQIASFITSGSGNTCPVLSNSGNTTPTATVAASSYTIPHSTPFKLSLNATDPDPSNLLTYTWEQMDAIGGTGTAITPGATATSGPLFRSYTPKSNPNRYFPSLSVLTGNMSGTYEVLPTVVRTMNFRGTVRDNHSGAGSAAYANVAVNTLNCGAFEFTNMSSNTALVANGTNTVTLTWNTAVTCVPMANIKISFSTDGGQTFPYTILSSTPNDGSETIVVPSLPTCSGRFMIESIGNIYFNINRADISITSPSLANGTSISPDNTVNATPGSASLNLSIAPAYGTTINPTITGTISTASPAGNLSFYNPNTLSCNGPSNSNRYQLLEFTPSVSGTYSFTKTNSGSAVLNLYKTAYNSGNVCENFLASSASMNASNDGVILSNTVSAQLCANQKYQLQTATFSNGSVALPYNYSITMTPPSGGSISSGITNPPGYNYMFSIVNNGTGNIVRISSTPDLSNANTFPAGAYTVSGLSANNTAAALNSTYAGTPFNSFNTAILNQSGGLYAQLSSNQKSVNIAAALPIRLLAFEAIKTNAHHALLSWKIMEDQLVSGYTIERSTDGAHFDRTGYVIAQKNPAVTQDYNFTDEQFAMLSGKVYYRLRIEGKDQSIQYSDIVILRNDDLKHTVGIYPNPVKDGLHITFDHPLAKTYTIAIIDVLGKTLWQEHYQKPAQNTALIIPVSQFSAGMYYINVHEGSEVTTQKFITE
ncbi:hypothetical protein DBR32_07395 [Taibaiella sp. KBW10]|uniref:zinc-dependent metalloprotease n=1 Tax=Taibaiella sp. KBW10 TaxID=2153357 RepID=UPI000F599F24|nr:zinc-dependent metalloprotease [Taibaiella sp. KBW10]RQO31761.1 hypothetical protein DBR32_07395 [Taibaiella sp. KBW10]